MRSQARGPQGFLWTGRGGDCSALFSAIPNHVRAVISCLNAPYGVETTTAGVQLTRYDAYLPPPDGPLAPEVPVESGGEPQPSSPPGTPTDDQQVDVLVLYTSAVRQAVEAMGMNVQQVMRDEVDTTQMAMDRSTSPGDPVIADVHFVHAAEVSRVDSGEFSWTWNTFELILSLSPCGTTGQPISLCTFVKQHQIHHSVVWPTSQVSARHRHRVQASHRMRLA